MELQRQKLDVEVAKVQKEREDWLKKEQDQASQKKLVDELKTKIKSMENEAKIISEEREGLLQKDQNRVTLLGVIALGLFIFLFLVKKIVF